MPVTSSEKANTVASPGGVKAIGAEPHFPVIGIGASAGGLGAFKQFLENVNPDAGAAYVLVQHLDPQHESLLRDILARATQLDVLEACDGLKVEPNHVYVITPNVEMRIVNGVLRLTAPEEPRSKRHPIDLFFNSLAEDQREYAVGIILSGNGSDGTLGCRAILDSGGRTLAQDPAEADFAGMPENTIAAGNAERVLSVSAMPKALFPIEPQNHECSGDAVPNPMPAINTKPQSSLLLDPRWAATLLAILQRLQSISGHDFSLYKKNTIIRRIQWRMSLHKITDIKHYRELVERDDKETRALFNDLLINVTQFFRDPEAFDVLEHEILPGLLADKAPESVVRVWIAGCATGEEAYSVAIVLREVMEAMQLHNPVQLYATDLDEGAINTARLGRYPAVIAKDISPERLQRFFTFEDEHYRIKKEIREMLVFAVQNLAQDPPFIRLDLLCCRNVMIYLEAGLQNRLVAAFHYALRPGGVLFLSPSESLGVHSSLFVCLHRKWRFYSALHAAHTEKTATTNDLAWNIQRSQKLTSEPTRKNKELLVADLTRRMLLQDYVPVSVATDRSGNIVYVHGDTSDFLRPAPGQASLNVVDMAREGLSLELRSALHRIAQGETPPLQGTANVLINSNVKSVGFSIHSLSGTELEEPLLLICFSAVAPDETGVKKNRNKNDVSVAEKSSTLERELNYARANYQSAIEALQDANEEYKSTNEELQSTNEELQSSNEELETSREELQSINEELTTVNTELQSKIEQLGDMQNDMKNLLDNINVGTLFLDTNLTIRRFTRDATKVYRLISGDVGRPLADIMSNIEDNDLLAHARQVLDTLIPYEVELKTSSDSWFLVRIQPYRSLDNVIDGVVLTFHDINKVVGMDKAAKTARELAEAIADTVTEPLLVLDKDLQVVIASRSFCRDFRLAPENLTGRSLYEIGAGQWGTPDLRERLNELTLTGSKFDDLELTVKLPKVGNRRLLINGRYVTGQVIHTPMILLVMRHLPIAE